MVKHVIGDVHLDKRLYEHVPMWRGKVHQHIKDAFEQALDIPCDVRLFAGDFFNHYSVSEEMLKYAIHQLSRYPEVHNIILGGNHDSTKVYSKVSSLDVLEETSNIEVINSFHPNCIKLKDGTTITLIPHMKSQEDFDEACNSISASDIVLLHCTYGDRPPYIQSTNDLYLSPEIADEMAEKHGNVFIGHVHKHRTILPNFIQLGSIIPQGPRQLGWHGTYLLDVENRTTPVEMTAQPEWERTIYKYEDVTTFLRLLNSLTAAVNFVYVKDIEPKQVKAAKIAYDAFIEDSEIIILCYFDKEEDESLADIKYYDMSFNVRTELNLFAEETKMKSEQYSRMDGYLNDALEAEEMEDDDK